MAQPEAGDETGDITAPDLALSRFQAFCNSGAVGSIIAIAIMIPVVVGLYFLWRHLQGLNLHDPWDPSWNEWIGLGFSVGVIGIFVALTTFVMAGHYWLRFSFPVEKALRRGDLVRADRAVESAITYARSFRSDDQRRGWMLCVLAGHLDILARSREAGSLFDEGLPILARHHETDHNAYRHALNEYAAHLIYVKQYEAARQILISLANRIFALQQKDQFLSGGLLTSRQQRILAFQVHKNLTRACLGLRHYDEAVEHLKATAGQVSQINPRDYAPHHDAFILLRCLFHLHVGDVDGADRALLNVKNRDDPALGRVRGKIALLHGEYPTAEACLRDYFEAAQKTGRPHRPELLDAWLDLAEALFGQGRHQEALQPFLEARRVVADLQLPCDWEWRDALAKWIPRARELGMLELAESLQAELANPPAAPEPRITVLDSTHRPSHVNPEN